MEKARRKYVIEKDKFPMGPYFLIPAAAGIMIFRNVRNRQAIIFICLKKENN